MINFGNAIRRVSDEIIIFLVVLIVLLPINSLNMPFVRRDSGVFLYSGWRILNGEAPYRDIWDNKPPVIFYINAAGLAISGGSRWGVWLIEFVSLTCAALIGFKLLKQIFGRLPALLSSYLWALTLIGILSGGNYATEYTLPMQFACLWLAYESERREAYSWRGYLIGLLCGLAFFTKQNTIGIGIAIVLYILISRLKPASWKKALFDLSFILFGGMTTLAAIVSLLAFLGVTQQFWEASFFYNFIYSSSSFLSHVKSITTGMFYLSTLTLLALIGWGMSLLGLKFKKLHLRQTLDPVAVSLLSIGLIDLPIEVIMASISGFSFRHYYMALLPIYAVFAGFSFWMLLAKRSSLHLPTKIMRLSKSQIHSGAGSHACDSGAWEPPRRKNRVLLRLLNILIAAIFFVPLLGASIALVKDTNYLTNQGIDYGAVTAYIELHTSKDDFVLVWGAETGINYATQRRSPSRFVYQYPLYEAGYTNQKIVEEFLGDIVRNKPRLIIDTKNPETPIYDFGIFSPQIDSDLQLLQSSYKVEEEFGPWTVYEYVGN